MIFWVLAERMPFSNTQKPVDTSKTDRVTARRTFRISNWSIFQNCLPSVEDGEWEGPLASGNVLRIGKIEPACWLSAHSERMQTKEWAVMHWNRAGKGWHWVTRRTTGLGSVQGCETWMGFWVGRKMRKVTEMLSGLWKYSFAFCVYQLDSSVIWNRNYFRYISAPNAV